MWRETQTVLDGYLTICNASPKVQRTAYIGNGALPLKRGIDDSFKHPLNYLRSSHHIHCSTCLKQQNPRKEKYRYARHRVL